MYSPVPYTGLTGEFENVAGTTTKIYVAPVEWFETINDVPKIGDATSAADAVKITAAHLFKTGKGFITLETTQDEGEYSSNDSEKFDAAGGLKEIKDVVCGPEEELAGNFRKLNNTKVIALKEDSNGKVRQVGSFRWGAKLKASYKTDKTPDGRAQYDLLIKSFHPCQQYYPFAIELHP